MCVSTLDRSGPERDSRQRLKRKYRKVVYKSCVICAIFQLFSVASIQGQLYMQCSESAKRLNVVWHMYNESATLPILNVNKLECRKRLAWENRLDLALHS